MEAPVDEETPDVGWLESGLEDKMRDFGPWIACGAQVDREVPGSTDLCPQYFKAGQTVLMDSGQSGLPPLESPPTW